jgi:DNA-directed RNA polymerase specialized sigma24 family protein
MSGAIGAAACQALRDYDSARQVPLSAFVYQRMMASALAQYRREWSFALRHVSNASSDAAYPRHAVSDSPIAIRLTLQRALYTLSHAENALARHLYWEGRTEAEAAERLKISHQAVNKRKRVIAQKPAAAPVAREKGHSGCNDEHFSQYIGRKDIRVTYASTKMA